MSLEFNRQTQHKLQNRSNEGIAANRELRVYHKPLRDVLCSKSAVHSMKSSKRISATCNITWLMLKSRWMSTLSPSRKLLYNDALRWQFLQSDQQQKGEEKKRAAHTNKQCHTSLQLCGKVKAEHFCKVMKHYNIIIISYWFLLCRLL